MKKTLSVNINGLQFVIDDDAYNKLYNYLETIKSHYSNQEEYNEIIADIEGRIAELLTEKQVSPNQIINLFHVEAVIEQLGYPEDFEPSDTANQGSKNGSQTKKKLFRDPHQKLLGGVCTGLSNYLNIDLVVLRIIFVVLLFVFAGSPIFLYIILWIVIPEATTASQRLQMEGDSININNIEKQVRQTYEKAKESYTEYVKSDSFNNIKTKGKEFGKNIEKNSNTLLKIVIGVIALVIISGILMFAFGFDFNFTPWSFNSWSNSNNFSNWHIATNNHFPFRFLLPFTSLGSIMVFTLILVVIDALFKLKLPIGKILLILLIIWLVGWVIKIVFSIIFAFAAFSFF